MESAGEYGSTRISTKMRELGITPTGQELCSTAADRLDEDSGLPRILLASLPLIVEQVY